MFERSTLPKFFKKILFRAGGGVASGNGGSFLLPGAPASCEDPGLLPFKITPQGLSGDSSKMIVSTATAAIATFGLGFLFPLGPNNSCLELCYFIFAVAQQPFKKGFLTKTTLYQ